MPKALGALDMTTEEVLRLVEAEISSISQAELVDQIRKFQIQPRMENRDWDYGEPDQAYPCWIVLEDKGSNIAVAYCEEGFGPQHPWGMLFLSGEHMNMGMDAAWYTHLEDCVRESPLWEGSNPPGYEVR